MAKGHGSGSKGNGGATLMPCTCVHEQQQWLYGRLRVHNKCNGGWRCTVCGVQK